MTLPPGPKPGLTLASCHASGCQHHECAAAAGAAGRAAQAIAAADAAGSRRRLRALAAFGWAPAELAGRLRIPVHEVIVITYRNPFTVSPERAAAIRALYDDLWDVPGGDGNVAAWARGRGWPPPLGWDDDPDDGHGIDDPKAVPAPGWQRPAGQRRHLPDLIEDLAELTRQGCTIRAAAQRLGISPKSVSTFRRRYCHGAAQHAQAGTQQSSPQQTPLAEQAS